jgi:hypothetical protein
MLDGAPIAVAAHSLHSREGAIIRSLGLGAKAKVGAEAGFLLLRERFGDSGLATFVMAADVLPEFAVDAADAAQFPTGMRELLDEDMLVRVRWLVGLLEPAEEVHEFRGVLRGEQVSFGGSGRGFVR